MTQQNERRFANEWLREFASDKHYQTRVWLGPLPPGQEANEYMVVGRWADAILFEPHLITIIEFKLDPEAGAVGQLQLYEQMFKQTLRFQQYWDRPIIKKLVTTRIDDHVKELCDTAGITYEVFHPDWITFWEKRRFKL